MPVLSKFYGIVIRMVFIRPFGAHFHAFYGDSELMVAIRPLRILQGDAPARVKRLVLDWASQHETELASAWRCLSLEQRPARIEPLE